MVYYCYGESSNIIIIIFAHNQLIELKAVLLTNRAMCYLKVTIAITLNPKPINP
jgi:hypothetical protein